MSFEDPVFAQEYERKLGEEGYPGLLLEYVLQELHDCHTVVDVGAGTGFFSVPLARDGKKVTAVEPSPHMAAILAGKVTPDIKDSLKVFIGTWESWEGGNADGLICIHSLYGMKNLRRSLMRMKEVSKKSLVIVRASQGRRVMAQEIRDRRKIRTENIDYYERVTGALKENGIGFSMQDIVEEKTIIISDLEKETDYYCNHLKAPASQRKAIRECIISISEEYRNGYAFKVRHHDYLFIF